jgi:hypothetical protein
MAEEQSKRLRGLNTKRPAPERQLSGEQVFFCVVRLAAHVSLVFLDHANLKVIKVDGFYKIVLGEARLAVALKLTDSAIQPDGLPQVKTVTDLIQRPEDLVRSGVIASVLDADIPEHVVVLEGPRP